jgi:methylated-DNA-[protein]-cysteine S-methyltransferase
VRLRYTWIDSPVGRLLLGGDGSALSVLEFAQGRHARGTGAGWIEDRRPFERAIDQLADYFAGRLKRFDLPLAPRGTGFQLEVWNALLEIPYGETRSYSAIATAIGRPSAVRAVGAANGKNPIAIVVPCHRVIGAAGDLTGFGGGLDVKRHLLRLEGALPAETGALFPEPV